MSGLVESATAVMQLAERKLEIVSRNVANLSTPGYKRRIAFSEMVERATVMSGPATTMAVRQDFDQGKLVATDNPLDLAVSGSGFFKVRNGEAVLYTRQGQFRRDARGALVTPQGYVLQQAGGGDLIVDDGALTVEPDGMVLQAGRPIGRIMIERSVSDESLTAVGESFFSAAIPDHMEEATDATLRQGMIEQSNVVLGDEMTAAMIALRQAENGARLVQVYDDLMGRAVTAFGQAGR